MHQESSRTFIKRVVAGSGDTISMLDGRVIRNGVQEQDSTYTEPCGSDPSCTFRTPVRIPAGDVRLHGLNRKLRPISRHEPPSACGRMANPNTRGDTDTLGLGDDHSAAIAAVRVVAEPLRPSWRRRLSAGRRTRRLSRRL